MLYEIHTDIIKKMQFIGKPKPLLPFMNRKDCSVRLCTNFCPEWCDGIFPPPGPPPPLSFPDDKSDSGPTFSPLVIAIIGILTSAFLLVSYYAVITKYCNSASRRSREVGAAHNNDDFFDDDDDHDDNTHHHQQQQQHHNNNNNNNNNNNHEAWLINTPGLDEALIKKISVVKFKKGDGLISTSDCSVCLGEFSEDDALRLLPKCCHAFHVVCIDTWLRSHFNCPLCRANVISAFNSQPPHAQPNNINNNPHLLVDSGVFNNTSNNNSSNTNNNDVFQDHSSTGLENQVAANVEERQIMEGNGGNLGKTHHEFRAMSDLGYRGDGGIETMRRSISMDHRYETWVSIIPDVNRCSGHGEDCRVMKICQFDEQSCKRVAGESSKINHSSSSNNSNRNGVLHSVNKNGVVMKRSFSSGRFLFNKHPREKTHFFLYDILQQNRNRGKKTVRKELL